MRLPLLLLALAALAVAGCSSPPVEPAPSSSATSSAPPATTTPSLPTAGTGPSLVPFNQTFSLSLTEAYTATRFASAGNCVALGGMAHVLSGTAQATWTAATPSAQQLAFLAGTPDTLEPMDAQASPATWAIGHLVPDGNGTLAFAVVLPGPGAAYQQAVSLTLDLTATGPLEPDPVLRACVG